jgi:hypothetical protein
MQFLSLKAGKEIESIELNLLLNTSSISKAQIIGLGDLEEEDVDELLSKFQLRAGLYRGSIYNVRNNRIKSKYTWSDIPEYFLCLYYSYFGADDKSGGTGLFEKISAEALKNFIKGEVLTLGFPAQIGFNANLDRIAETCFEERGKPADGSYKDDGVDVIGFKSFGDRRSANLYILLQCAAGIHWTIKKPIEFDRWTQYIYWIEKNIVASISTVEYVEEKDWQKRSTTYGMLLDRLRIYNFLYESEVNRDLRTETINWCNAKLEEGL